MNLIESYYGGLKVLVTGGLGFIGSNLALRLIELGANVLVVDSLQPNTGGNPADVKTIYGRLQIRIVDLRRCDEIADLLPGHNVIFNLAGTVSHIDSMTDPVADLGANVHAQ